MAWVRLKVGDVIDWWTVKKLVRRGTCGIAYMCECRCGHIAIKAKHELGKQVKSCGCYRRQHARRKRTEEEKEKYRLGHLGKRKTPTEKVNHDAAMARPEVRKKLSESHKGQKWDDSKRAKIMRVFSDPQFQKRNAANSRRNWQNPDYVKKQMRSRGVSPNKLEIRFADLCETNGFPFKYVGDGELVIGGKCPDFHDGGNLLIEIYGDYWHRGQDPKDRIRFFAKHKYKCLVIWERELRNASAIKNKIRRFLRTARKVGA